jgi:Leucine-rich repeat (LRR) protein
MKLWLRGCENLEELPQNIASLFSLLILDLFFCKTIKSLPINIGQLQHLTVLLL